MSAIFIFFIRSFVDNSFGEPKDIAAIVMILLRDVSRMGYLAKQVFEVLEVNSEKDIEASSEDLNDSFREPISWNRLTSIYEVN